MQTNDGGFLMVGGTQSSDGGVTENFGASDLWAVKTDASGNLEWQKSLGGSGADGGNGASLTVDGGYVIVGVTTSSDGHVTSNNCSTDVWILKLSANGNLEW